MQFFELTAATETVRLRLRLRSHWRMNRLGRKQRSWTSCTQGRRWIRNMVGMIFQTPPATATEWSRGRRRRQEGRTDLAFFGVRAAETQCVEARILRYRRILSFRRAIRGTRAAWRTTAALPAAATARLLEKDPSADCFWSPENRLFEELRRFCQLRKGSCWASD